MKMKLKITEVFKILGKQSTSEEATVGCKNIQVFAIVLAIFLRFDCQFLSSHADIQSVKPKYHDLTNIYFIKLR